jgi:hypothetical protein
MRVIVVGDLHGRETWKLIDPGQFDRIIFLGDYVDSLVIHPWLALRNLREIIDLKRQYPHKITLLLGNHDIQYSEFPFPHTCANICYDFQPHYTQLFRENKELFKVAEGIDDYLFTHAGVTNQFIKTNLSAWSDEILNHEYHVADLLNDLHQEEFRQVLHTVGKPRGGRDVCGGITWADMSETFDDHLVGYHQVVGHTPVKKFTTTGDYMSSITYIDLQQKNSLDHFYQLDIP